jgi:hypothetical protein
MLWLKKILLVGVFVFTMVVGAFAVYADSPNTNVFSSGRGYGHSSERGYGHMNGNEFNREIDLNDEEREQLINERQEERTEYREERINNAFENGSITEEQATQWRGHFTEMDEFYKENGYIGGSCHGGSAERGYGRGMMDGYDY